MFDKLIDFLLKQIDNIIPVVFIFQFEQGVKYQFGKYVCILNPGLHFKIPYINIILKEQITDTTMTLAAQSVHTEDGIEVIVKAAIGYKISNIAWYFNNVYDVKSAIADNASIAVRRTISANEYDFCKDNIIGLDETIAEVLQESVTQYGVKINFIGITDLTNSRSYRLFNEVVPINQ